jgi:S-(hydroxymethyl)glutathione dehydrogenase/alcohol dehydrogenase
MQGFGTGGFSERTVVSEVTTIRIPDGVPDNVAALCGCAVSTGLGAAWNLARIEPGSSVVVFGTGAVGLSVVMGARLTGADPIVAVDPDPQRRSTALEVGATVAVSPEEDLRRYAPAGFDYALECAGRPEPMEWAVKATRRGGTAVLIGVASPDANVSIKASDFVPSQRRIIGCLTGDVRPDIDLDRFFRLYLRGDLPLNKLVTRAIPFAEIARGFEMAANGDGIRTMVEMA